MFECVVLSERTNDLNEASVLLQLLLAERREAINPMKVHEHPVNVRVVDWKRFWVVVIAVLGRERIEVPLLAVNRYECQFIH